MNRYNGFVSFDLLFSSLLLLLMLSTFLSTTHIAAESMQAGAHLGRTLSRLESVADLVVERGGVERSYQGRMNLDLSASYRPNVLTQDALNAVPQEELRNRMEMSGLEIGLEEGDGTCIFRLVLMEGEIRKLYVCGG